MAKESPRTVVRFLAYERERVSDDLARGAVDVAVAVDPPEAPGLRQSVLYRETFVCIAPQRKPLTLRGYLGAGHLSTTAHTGYSGVDQVLSERGHVRRIVASTSFFATAAQLADEPVGEGRGAARGERGGRSYLTSKRSRFITLVHAATKSWTNFSPASELA